MISYYNKEILLYWDDSLFSLAVKVSELLVSEVIVDGGDTDDDNNGDKDGKTFHPALKTRLLICLI
jgi:hypothetical protein